MKTNLVAVVEEINAHIRCKELKLDYSERRPSSWRRR
jgi:hypothetical protein